MTMKHELDKLLGFAPTGIAQQMAQNYSQFTGSLGLSYAELSAIQPKLRRFTYAYFASVRESVSINCRNCAASECDP